ncbi:MAG: DUF971 domain-containing protein [Burkholderiaceae bacterium]|jgi:DUF971 family protein
MTGVELPLSVDVAADALTLHWTDGATSLAAADLRARCRCADCHSARLRGVAQPDGDAATTLVGASAVGHYALQLRFGDGHDRGIFPWAALRALSRVAAISAGNSG